MKKNTLLINPKVLLVIYVVMPISLVFIGIDALVFDGQARRILPVDPRVYTWFILLFMVPHIIASFFSFAEKEYVDHYRSGLLRGTQIAVALGLFLPALAGATILPVLAFVIYTMVHVFMQQSGVSKSLMRNATSSHAYWQWIGIGISVLLYAYLLLPMPWLKNVLHGSGLLLFIGVPIFLLYNLLAIDIVRKSRTKLGRIYFLGSHSIPILGILYIATGYPIIALVVPRIIHDLTAFVFYITHDNNRFIKHGSNFLYRATSKVGLPVYIANPVLSILLAFAISKFNSATVAVLLTCIFFMHYYTESIIWKKDTLHRQHITFMPYE